MKNILLITIAAALAVTMNAQDKKPDTPKVTVKAEKPKSASLEQQVQILKGQLDALRAENQRLAKLISFLSSERSPEANASQATIDKVQAELGCRLDVNFNCIPEQEKK